MDTDAIIPGLFVNVSDSRHMLTFADKHWMHAQQSHKGPNSQGDLYINLECNIGVKMLCKLSLTID